RVDSTDRTPARGNSNGPKGGYPAGPQVFETVVGVRLRPAGAVTHDDEQLVIGSVVPIRREGGVNTAKRFHSIATSARTIVLAGSLALASVFPTAGLVYADGGVMPSTP